MPISHARTDAAREEEQRLLYVAVTRAAEVLRCTWAQSRTFGGDPVTRQPSPYLAWIRSAVTRLEASEATAEHPTEALHASREVLERDAAAIERAAADAGVELRLRNEVTARLRSWRTDQARVGNVRPTVVLPDKALDSLARERPTAPADLEQVAGLGLLTRERHGHTLLALVAEAVAGANADPSDRAIG